MLLSAPADPAGPGAAGPAGFAGARASATASGAASGAAAPAPVATNGPGDSAGAATGRDPFEGDGALAGARGAVAPSSAALTSPPHTQTSAPASPGAPAGMPTGLPTTAPTHAPAPTGATATVTVTTGATYLGLYGWNGNRAAFRVNAKAYSVARGAAFGSGLRFTGVVQRGGEACAIVAHAGGTVTVCPGQVLHIG